MEAPEHRNHNIGSEAVQGSRRCRSSGIIMIQIHHITRAQPPYFPPARLDFEIRSILHGKRRINYHHNRHICHMQSPKNAMVATSRAKDDEEKDRHVEHTVYVRGLSPTCAASTALNVEGPCIYSLQSREYYCHSLRRVSPGERVRKGSEQRTRMIHLTYGAYHVVVPSFSPLTRIATQPPSLTRNAGKPTTPRMAEIAYECVTSAMNEFPSLSHISSSTRCLRASCSASVSHGFVLDHNSSSSDKLSSIV
jgi:hypothetical protein